MSNLIVFSDYYHKIVVFFRFFSIFFVFFIVILVIFSILVIIKVNFSN